MSQSQKMLLHCFRLQISHQPTSSSSSAKTQIQTWEMDSERLGSKGNTTLLL